MGGHPDPPIYDADTLHPWVFRGIEGYAAPAPMPEWAEPHLMEQHDEFEQLVGDAAETGDVGDDEFERLVGPAAAPSPVTGVARGSSTSDAATLLSLFTYIHIHYLFVLSASVHDRRGFL